ncbi:Trihelix transcription factor GT-3b [Glycine soja]|nr:Trihelix transcription factor GT-3b [Glycine soja]
MFEGAGAAAVEPAGDAGVHSDTRGAGERLHCVEAEQDALGSGECEDEGERVQEKPRTVISFGQLWRFPLLMNFEHALACRCACYSLGQTSGTPPPSNYGHGKETSDPEHGKQCPFFEELHAVFTQRAHNMQRLLLESETRSAQTKKGVKRSSGDRSSEELSEDDNEVEYDSEEEKPSRSNTRKRKVDKVGVEKSSRASNPSNSASNSTSIQEMLKEFFQHQLSMEMQWREMMERRAHERQLFEQEWRQSMEKLERERLMIEQAWREREEQRRMREESRAERRDALLTTLLNKLINESN